MVVKRSVGNPTLKHAYNVLRDSECLRTSIIL